MLRRLVEHVPMQELHLLGQAALSAVRELVQAGEVAPRVVHVVEQQRERVNLTCSIASCLLPASAAAVVHALPPTTSWAPYVA